MDLSSFGFSVYAETDDGISDTQLKNELARSLSSSKGELKKVLIIPPDYTRFHSGAGKITKIYYDLLKDSCDIDILPALGTHVAMTRDEVCAMYGDIPFEKFIYHNWHTDIAKIGEVPGKFIEEVSEGLIKTPIAVEVNRRLLDSSYDLILSIGQVVPHEVVGMANRNKNIFVGIGGSDMINSSHMLGAFYGMERIMGKDHSPVRKVFDYAEEHFLSEIPLKYVLTVTTAPEGNIKIHGLFVGRERKYFEEAVALSQRKNLKFVDEPFKKVVVMLDDKEFKSTWLGNKSVYRTRMAIADGGELIVLAPGVDKFGEDANIDKLIRKYGYCGREKILTLVEENEDLRGNLSAAAHLIHGSSDGRFSITYCTRYLTEKEVRGACFDYIPYEEAIRMYDPEKLTDGYNTLENGERIYYISNPALGLWADRARF
ncbi:MAG: lactate racemase domain-containing protein [Oscillospiraceae bacterium]|nr:lactate racemase domain-containing protein [Oscillospiraceae bacterium]